MKVEGWREKLIQYLATVATQDFEFGRNDCALFVAGAVDIQIGTTYHHEWLGKYATLSDGYRRMQTLGINGHVDMIATHLDEVPVAFAQIGDVAVLENSALGIVQGSMIYVLTPGRGIGTVALTDAVRMFRVI